MRTLYLILGSIAKGTPKAYELRLTEPVIPGDNIDNRTVLSMTEHVGILPKGNLIVDVDKSNIIELSTKDAYFEEHVRRSLLPIKMPSRSRKARVDYIANTGDNISLTSLTNSIGYLNNVELVIGINKKPLLKANYCNLRHYNMLSRTGKCYQ